VIITYIAYIFHFLYIHVYLYQELLICVV